AEVFVKRPRETIRAAMLAPTIGVEAPFEADIRAVVPRKERLGRVVKKLRAGMRIFFRRSVGVAFDAKRLEAIGRIDGGPASMDHGKGVWWSVHLNTLSHFPSAPAQTAFADDRGLRRHMGTLRVSDLRL